jgi:hypothetical protein
MNQLALFPHSLYLVEFILDGPLPPLKPVRPLSLVVASVLEGISPEPVPLPFGVLPLITLAVSPYKSSLPFHLPQLPFSLIHIPIGVVHPAFSVALVGIETSFISVSIRKRVYSMPKLGPIHNFPLEYISVAVELFALAVREALRPAAFVSVPCICILKPALPFGIEPLHLSSIIAITSKDKDAVGGTIAVHRPFEDLFIWEIEHELPAQYLVLRSASAVNRLVPICFFDDYFPEVVRLNHNLSMLMVKIYFCLLDGLEYLFGWLNKLYERFNTQDLLRERNCFELYEL